MDEYATAILGDPWDMNTAGDLVYYRDGSGMSNSVFDEGIYSALMADRDGNGAERITLLTAGAQDNAAMRIGKIGYNFPINADRYRYLAYRLYKSNSECNNSGLVIWYADDSYSNNALGVSNSFPVTPGAAAPCDGWYTIVQDLATIGLQSGSKDWSGTIRELIIKPFAGSGIGMPPAAVKLDYARLTAEDPRTARPFTIQWAGDGTGGDVTLYASPGNRVLESDDFFIVSSQNPSGGSFQFQTGILPAGEYYIAAENSNGIAWSDSPLVINAPPQVTIATPSMTSGRDYATTEIGDSWDMDGPGDLNDSLPQDWETCVTDESYSSNMYRAELVSDCPVGPSFSDSKLIIGHMNPPGPDPIIDTNAYRYLSFRFYHSGEQNIAEGWVARFGWWQTDGGVTTETTMMSRDIIISEGWNTYKVDLWADDVVDETILSAVPWRNSAPNRLRFDPSELFFSRFPASIALDWIKLTAMDEVDGGDVYTFYYNIEARQDVTLTFYYDEDKNPDNGRTSIGSAKVGIVTMGGSEVKRVYLPLLTSGSSANTNCDPVHCFRWDTTNVFPGTYYICINSEDAYNETYHCSEAPMIVR